MQNNLEILSPVGDFECLKAAVQNGADAVYFGVSDFNARNFATNFDMNNLEDAINYAKLRNVKVHLVLNILIKNNEFNDALNIAKRAYELGVDAIIVQDMGLALTLINAFPDLPIHASTQMTVHNLDGVKTLEKLGFRRAVLSRELSINEINYICKNSNIEIETFIHGALCVSYSGQCLFSSIIGGRSGNRGKCAGTCRLPYKLIETSNNVKNIKNSSIVNYDSERILDSGYLLSTKDLCGLKYLPDLVKSGVTCFKIEGRMKTPVYVATVTRIYRKYLDKILNNENYIVEPNDIKELQLVFNRGGFSDGYLEPKPNRNLVYKEQPNHIGIYLGKVLKFNQNKGYVTLKLENELSIGDKIAIESNNYTVSELIKNSANIKSALPKDIVTIGRMKGNININDRISLLESKRLTNLSTNNYQTVDNHTIKIDCSLIITAGKQVQISAKIVSDNLPNISSNITTNIIPETAKSAPITIDKIVEQFYKTGNTIFKFENLDVSLDNNLFLPISSINELRRIIIDDLETKLIKSFKRTVTDNNNLFTTTSLNSNCSNKEKPVISVLLNNINKDLQYNNLNNIDNIYVPLRYFFNPSFKECINTISKKCNLYIYMPVIMKNNYINLLNVNISNIFSTYAIKGAVVSNIGQLKWFENYDIDLVGNYTLNILNDVSKKYLKTLGFNRLTLSPELDKASLTSMTSTDNSMELIIYGKAPVMNSNYCVLGNTTSCYKECPKYCKQADKKYYLRDRLNFDFRVIPDNIDTISTIYNSKITSLKWKEFNVYNLRIDVLDEDIETINTIVTKTLNNERFEGKDYTNANLNKDI